jgi:hypothetical protein
VCLLIKLEIRLKVMETTELVLPLEYKGVKINVRKHVIHAVEVYRVVFADGRPPMTITEAQKNSRRTFWTSIPEGRQQEAEDIGELITNHFKLL